MSRLNADIHTDPEAHRRLHHVAELLEHALQQALVLQLAANPPDVQHVRRRQILALADGRSTHMSVEMSTHMAMRMPMHMSIHPFINMSISMPTRMSIRVYTHVCTHAHSVHDGGSCSRSPLGDISVGIGISSGNERGMLS